MIGELDNRIEIYSVTETSDGFGGVTTANVLYKTVWAQMVPSGGTEGFEAKKLTAVNQVIFIIRYLAALTEKYKIKYESNWYDILKIEAPDRKRYLNVVAEKKY